MELPEEKVCSKCKKTKPASDFTILSAYRDRPARLYSQCKPCKAKGGYRNWRRRMQADPGHQWIIKALGEARYRAKRNGIPCDVSEAYLSDLLAQSNQVCAYCGVHVVLFGNTTATRDTSASLDRILQEPGYTEGNVAICCHKCNALKSDATLEELQRLCESLRGLLENRSKA